MRSIFALPSVEEVFALYALPLRPVDFLRASLCSSEPYDSVNEPRSENVRQLNLEFCRVDECTLDGTVLGADELRKSARLRELSWLTSLGSICELERDFIARRCEWLVNGSWCDGAPGVLVLGKRVDLAGPEVPGLLADEEHHGVDETVESLEKRGQTENRKVQHVRHRVDEDDFHLAHDLQLSVPEFLHGFFVEQLLDVESDLLAGSCGLLRGLIACELGQLGNPCKFRVLVAQVVQVFHVGLGGEVLAVQLGINLNIGEHQHQQHLAHFVHERVAEHLGDHSPALVAHHVHLGADCGVLAHDVVVNRAVDGDDQHGYAVPNDPGQIPHCGERLHVTPADLVGVVVVAGKSERAQYHGDDERKNIDVVSHHKQPTLGVCFGAQCRTEYEQGDVNGKINNHQVCALDAERGEPANCVQEPHVGDRAFGAVFGARRLRHTSHYLTYIWPLVAVWALGSLLNRNSLLSDVEYPNTNVSVVWKLPPDDTPVVTVVRPTNDTPIVSETIDATVFLSTASILHRAGLNLSTSEIRDQAADDSVVTGTDVAGSVTGSATGLALALTIAFSFNSPSTACFPTRSSSWIVLVFTMSVIWSTSAPILAASCSFSLYTVVEVDSSSWCSNFGGRNDLMVTTTCVVSPGRRKIGAKVTHFPNVYSSDRNLRVVRIARVATVDHPKFELDEYLEFTPKIEQDGLWFDTEPSTPLANHLPREQAQQIVDTVNKLLENQYSPLWGPYMVLDTLTFGILRKLRWDKTYADELEQFIEQTNESLRAQNIPVVFVSPRRSGYLSLDALVPTPR
ncbi:hypothetical protein OGAPHI_006679 [Ogataea philodendri]|uniref:Golgin subfamily A member 7/ERF4 domain-containing protein n=1 Tax=Ogataea philodendri TaxID=1378263 RepID=A0A9P8NY01_9ASCO|nr:uncharacterized protein OGAPHI_006679 [Ogataea philodendri]KAH3661272.1 hypothetical protein OGAPHI_006679 [Ogataea philodendri]